MPHDKYVERHTLIPGKLYSSINTFKIAQKTDPRVSGCGLRWKVIICGIFNKQVSWSFSISWCTMTKTGKILAAVLKQLCDKHEAMQPESLTLIAIVERLSLTA